MKDVKSDLKPRASEVSSSLPSLSCKNPKCRRKSRKDSKFCCLECHIHYDNMQNPRPSNEEIERRAVLKSYFNCVILPNIPDENLTTLFNLLENALKISEAQGIPQAREWLKNELEKIKNARA